MITIVLEYPEKQHCNELDDFNAMVNNNTFVQAFPDVRFLTELVLYTADSTIKIYEDEELIDSFNGTRRDKVTDFLKEYKGIR